jgi:hypothetical protein
VVADRRGWCAPARPVQPGRPRAGVPTRRAGTWWSAGAAGNGRSKRSSSSARARSEGGAQSGPPGPNARPASEVATRSRNGCGVGVRAAEPGGEQLGAGQVLVAVAAERGAGHDERDLVGAPTRAASTVAAALTNEAANSRPLPTHRASPWVPAEVRWTTVAPSSSVRDLGRGVAEVEPLEAGRPPSSPASTTRPGVAERPHAAPRPRSAVSTASTSGRRGGGSHGTVVNARRTSITTTTSSGSARREVDEPDRHQSRARWQEADQPGVASTSASTGRTRRAGGPARSAPGRS